MEGEEIGRRSVLTFSGQQHPEIVVQQPVPRIQLSPRLGKGLQPVAIGLASDRRREAEGLVEQRHAAAVAAELIIGLKEGLPARIAGRHRIDRHDVPVIGIGEKRVLVLRDAVADIGKIRSVADPVVIVANESK